LAAFAFVAAIASNAAAKKNRTYMAFIAIPF
jgi:hypothetical protein